MTAQAPSQWPQSSPKMPAAQMFAGHAREIMARYSYEQGLAVRLVKVEEMFAESTTFGEVRV